MRYFFLFLKEDIRNKILRNSTHTCTTTGEWYYWQKYTVPPKDYYSIKEVDRRLSYMTIKPFFIICDVGGAAGIDLLSMSKMGAQGTLVDINRDALRAGKRMARGCDMSSKVNLIRASATELPFRDEIFHLVTCFSVLDHLSCKDLAYKAICEFSRITQRFGFTSITVPNELFLIGTFTMKIIQYTQHNAFWEQRFSPRELEKMIIRSGLKPLIFESKYPTNIGSHIILHNFPEVVQKMPRAAVSPIFLLAEKIFRVMNRFSCLRIFGARMGYISQKPERKNLTNY